MILVLGKSALSVPDTRFSRVSGSTLVHVNKIIRCEYNNRGGCVGGAMSRVKLDKPGGRAHVLKV